MSSPTHKEYHGRHAPKRIIFERNYPAAPAGPCINPALKENFMQTPGKLFGIIGYPLAQSMSPMLHNWGFEQTGFSGVYMLWPTAPEKLEDFFKAVRTLPISGGSITLPHKVTSMPFLDKVTERAKKVGAVNAFYWEGGTLCGENTDVTGFLDPIRSRSFASALVIGAGGACRAVLAGLKELGIARIGITNRTEAKAEALAKDFDITFVPYAERASIGAELVVNSTSQGMKGDYVNETAFPKEGFKGKGLAYDIVYNPVKTRFMKEAEEAGWEVQGGLDMFVGQAREAFRLWTSGELPHEGATALVKKALGL